MTDAQETLRRLAAIPNLQVSQDALLARYTRFGIGGPADVLAETADPQAFARALRTVHESGTPFVVIGGGTNLIVADEGFRGIVLRLTAENLSVNGSLITAEAGAELQALVDFSITQGLEGVGTLAGIPGSVGAAVYGNAGAYGHSISERIAAVRFFDGAILRSLSNRECEFRYRESIFKRHKEWIILAADLSLEPEDREELRRRADEIVAIRNRKFPPAMKCAGSVFKNLLLSELPEAVARQVPEKVVIEGKVPAAFFLEQAGAKNVFRGDIHVADYHANLVYNAGAGSAAELRAVIGELKSRVRARFGFELEEEVQYVGFEPTDR